MKSVKSSLKEKIAFLKLKSGDSDAFVFFYDKYLDRIYRFVLIKVSDKQIAEDLTQEIFLKTWQHLVDKKEIKSFQAFIFRIAYNSVADHYRQNNNQELPLEYVEEKEDTVGQDQATSLDKKIDSKVLLEKIKQLNPEYQEVLLLRYLEELSIEEIADILQKEKNNVSVTIHRALSKLKGLIDQKN